MNRPDNILAYDEMDLKLGIKSSLPHVKSTLALAILLWECSDHPAELIYSEQNADETVMASQLEQWVIDYLADICEEERISPDDLITGLNKTVVFISSGSFHKEKLVSLTIWIFAFLIHLAISHIENREIKRFDECVNLPCSG